MDLTLREVGNTLTDVVVAVTAVTMCVYSIYTVYIYETGKSSMVEDIDLKLEE